MKPAPTDRKVTGNLTGEKIAFTLADDPTHLMNLLTDIYKDRELACLREYATNALDAHKDGGVTAPIEVSLPGPLNPVLTVRDYGPGLDLDDIKTIFTRYGESTKRETDEATGMLGIGSKAALTYTDQFTVTSVKGGRKLACSVVRSEMGTPELTVVSDRPCSDATGVTVTIPAEAENRFTAKAETLFAFWAPGTVLVNGKAPEAYLPDLELGALQHEGRKLRVTVKLRNSNGIRPARTSHALVMGGVTYPLDLTGVHTAHQVIAFADIGAVDFLQSREQLHDTDRTAAVIDAVREHYLEQTKLEAARALREATSAPQAIEVASAWSEWLDDFTWRGRTVPVAGTRGKDTVTTYDGDNVRTVFMLRPNRYRGVNGSWGAYANPSEWNDLIFVTGFIPGKVTKAHRTRLEDYMIREAILPDLAAVPSATFLLIRGGELPAIYDGWVEDPIVLDWAEARKVPKDPNAPKRAPKGQGYDAFDPDTSYWSAFNSRASVDELEQLSGRLGYVPATDGWSYTPQRRFDQASAFLKLAGAGSGVVYVPENRIEKFKRLFPEAVSVRDWLRERGQRIKLSPAQALARGGVVGGAAWTRLDPAKVDDPYLAAAIRLVQAAQKARQPRAVEILSGAGVPVQVRCVTPDLSWVPEEYPLAIHPDASDKRVDKHLTLYVNQVYAIESEED